MRENYLEHHGILGQKWGVRRFQNKDGSRTSAGKVHQKELNQKKGLSDETKRNIKIGLAVTGVAVAAIGGYALYKSGKLDGIISLGKKTLDESDNVLGLNLESSVKTVMKTPESIDDFEREASLVNPTKGMGNCVSCSTALFCRSIGIDATALPDLPKREDGSQPGYKISSVIEAFTGAKEINLFSVNEASSRKEGYERLTKELLDQGEGASGIVKTYKRKLGVNFGHEVFYKVMDNKVEYFDGQKQFIGIQGQTEESHRYLDFFETTFSKCLPNETSYVRLDNCTDNINYDALSRIVSVKNNS